MKKLKMKKKRKKNLNLKKVKTTIIKKKNLKNQKIHLKQSMIKSLVKLLPKKKVNQASHSKR